MPNHPGQPTHSRRVPRARCPTAAPYFVVKTGAQKCGVFDMMTVKTEPNAANGMGVSLENLCERIAGGQVKALSILQPYPHHIFHNGKDVENRDWPTKGRGWFIIHAGKSKRELGAGDPPYPLGGIVGMARIVDCVTAMDSKWFFGRYGFVLRDAFPVDMIPCKGQLGFFTPPPDALEQLAESVRSLSHPGRG